MNFTLELISTKIYRNLFLWIIDYMTKGGGLPKKEKRNNEEGLSDTKRKGLLLTRIKVMIPIKLKVAVNRYSAF